MRGKRAKAYRKLMHKYELFFKFRQPYQILVDADFLTEANKCKMDLGAYLNRTVQGEIKPMITQCSMRHLYASSSTSNPRLVALAKTLERRRCNHHTLAEPLSTYDCLTSVIHPEKEKELRNKHRYIVATQDSKLRLHLRTIPGTPVLNITRSVMIMESMSEATTLECNQQEQAKFTEGILKKTPVRKRKREDDQENNVIGGDDVEKATTEPPVRKMAESGAGTGTENAKKKGPKRPNPLSMRKKKKTNNTAAVPSSLITKEVDGDEAAKKKRRKRSRKAGEVISEAAAPAAAALVAIEA